jgi:hypothetical protein
VDVVVLMLQTTVDMADDDDEMKSRWCVERNDWQGETDYDSHGGNRA